MVLILKSLQPTHSTSPRLTSPPPSELNFKHEASNAERCRANLASTKSRLAGR